MALVNPQIAMSYRPTTEYQPRNALAEYAQVQQIVGGQRQAEVADMQLRRMQQEDAEIERIHQIAMRQGGPDNRLEMGRALFASRNPQQRELGYKILQHEEAKTAFANAEQRFGYAPAKETTAPAAAAAAPATAMTAPAPEGELVAEPIRPIPVPVTALAAADAPAPAGETDRAYLQRQFGTPGGAAAGPNALAPAAPVTNAMLASAQSAATSAAAPAAAGTLTGLGGKTLAQLQDEFRAYSRLDQLGAPGAKGRLDEIKREIDFIYKTNEPGAEQNMMRALKIPLTEAGFAKFQRLKDSPSELTKLLDGLNLPPAQRRDFEMRMAQKLVSHPQGTSVTLVQEKAEKGKFGELLVDQYKNISNAASLAAKTLPALDTQAKILDQGFTTGFGTEVKKAGASLLSALGVPEAEKFATDAQTFLAATQQAVLQRQLEQKGPQTEADAQRITQTGAQLGNTVNANRFIIDVAKAQLKRDIDQRNFYAEWRRGPGKGSFDGAEDAWFSGPGGKSLFDRPELKKYAAPAGAAAPAAAPAIPQAAINDLRAGRGTDAQFDAIFGAGAAKRAREGK